MEKYIVKSPVAMVVFNRPDSTQCVFNQVRKVKPSKLYVIADGPREGNKEDVEKCGNVRKVFDNIDWECDVKLNYASNNLGCSKRPSSGFSWVFENEDKAIFLEDDCVPNVSFFRYCDETLEKYQDDERIMLVSGTNVIGKWNKCTNSYHFSKLGGIHGWASWRRAWIHFDIEIDKWNNPIIKELLKSRLDKLFYYERSRIYDKLVNNSNSTTAWDYQWGFARLINNGLAVVPKVNLITNIGYGVDSTHTNNPNSKTANLKNYELDFPLKCPEYIIEDVLYDRKMIDALSGSKWRRFASYIKHSLIKRVNNK